LRTFVLAYPAQIAFFRIGYYGLLSFLVPLEDVYRAVIVAEATAVALPVIDLRAITIFIQCQ